MKTKRIAIAVLALCASLLAGGCFEAGISVDPGGVVWTVGADHSGYTDATLCDAICDELDQCGSAAFDCYDACLSYSSLAIDDMDQCLLDAGSFCPAVDSCVPGEMLN